MVLISQEILFPPAKTTDKIKFFEQAANDKAQPPKAIPPKKITKGGDVKKLAKTISEGQQQILQPNRAVPPKQEPREQGSGIQSQTASSVSQPAQNLSNAKGAHAKNLAKAIGDLPHELDARKRSCAYKKVALISKSGIENEQNRPPGQP